jgi:hypothetical protein
LETDGVAVVGVDQVEPETERVKVCAVYPVIEASV